MPNHYTNVLMVYPSYRGEFEDRDMVQDLVTRDWGAHLLNRVRPMPVELENTQSPSRPPNPGLITKYGADNWYDWQVTNRGVKWDAYNVQPPVKLPGDCGAVQLTFCTAWGAPNRETCDAVVAELFEQYGADRVVWLGLDPSTDTFRVVGEWGEDARGYAAPSDASAYRTAHVLIDRLEDAGAELTEAAQAELEACDPQHGPWFARA